MTDEEFYLWYINKNNDVYLDCRTIIDPINFVEEIKSKYSVDLNEYAEDFYKRCGEKGNFQRYYNEFRDIYPFLKWRKGAYKMEIFEVFYE